MLIDYCPLCGAAAPVQYWTSVWNAPDKCVMRCTSCDAFFLDPMETEEDQRKFDVDYDRYIQSRSELVAQHTPQTFESLVEESIEIRFRDLERFFGKGQSVLEVGAERGGFLDRVAGASGTVAAVDSCPEYKNILGCKGYRTYLYIDDLPGGEVYDRICLFSLLEHVREPQIFLEKLREHLAPGGRMIIEVPSANDPLISLYDIPAFKSFYFQAMHPYVYSEKSIRMLAERCGMIIDQVIYKQRYGLANHLQWLKAGVPGGSALFASIFSGGADAEYVKSLERCGNTDTLYVIVRKS